MTKTLYSVTLLYQTCDNVSFITEVFPDRSSARRFLKEQYKRTFFEGHMNEPVELPGIFAGRSECSLCDGHPEPYIKPDHVNVWAYDGTAFEGKVCKHFIPLS